MPLAVSNNSLKQNGSIKFWSIIFIESWVLMSEWVNELVQLPKPIKWKLTLTLNYCYIDCESHWLMTHWTHKTSVPIFIMFWILGKYLDNHFNPIQNFKNIHDNTVVKYKFKKRTNKTVLFSIANSWTWGSKTVKVAIDPITILYWKLWRNTVEFQHTE